ncbi:MAG: hypothetical protein EZS28_010885 [Streblomastix strix]|uniref:Uncharacterized protein n=1 Tax=Streblomastix strix TaxID=222440 RepID=A0A5J4WF41_9EUKA|nr:MAG: hypothetical protein EZS28_010885 [Streblomastix strix]
MKLEGIFDLHFFQECAQNFNKINSDTEHDLLNLLELILERSGISIQFGILTLAHNSGLYDKIKQILLFRVAVEDQEHLHANDAYSQITEQLLRCYLWTVRFEPFDDLDSKIAITKILKKNISVLIRNLKQISMKQSESNVIEIKQQNKEDLDKQIQSVTKTLEAFRFTIHCGYLEENIQVQFWCLMNIKDLFSILRMGDEQRSFGQQRELLVYISEQYEQEGSVEDIDGNVFGYDGMKPTSYGARIEMYNRYVNKENRYLEFDDDEEEDDDEIDQFE